MHHVQIVQCAFSYTDEYMLIYLYRLLLLLGEAVFKFLNWAEFSGGTGQITGRILYDCRQWFTNRIRFFALGTPERADMNSQVGLRNIL